MKLKDFIALMDSIAPRERALSFDNVGLLIGPDHDEIRRVLVALDLSVNTANEAIETGADLVLTHHPQMFRPVQRILPDHPETAAVYRLIRHGIGHFAAHTNLDAAAGGVNDVLCKLMGLESVTVPDADGILRTGWLKNECSLAEFFNLVRDKLGENVRFTGDPDRNVRKIAVCGGAGDGALDYLPELEVDAFLTGEVKHSTALLMQALGIALITAGHYETEHSVLKPLISRLQGASNDVQYNLARSETSPFRCR